MNNQTIETDLASVLGQINNKLDTLSDDVAEIKVGQVRLEGKVESMDERLSGRIDALDERLSGRIDALDERLSGRIDALDERLSGQIKSLDEKLSGQIKAVDERLSGQIKAVDERLSGQIKAVETTVGQLDKRVGNGEFINRGVFVGLLLALLAGFANILGWLPKN